MNDNEFNAIERATKPTVASPVEPVVSCDLLKAQKFLDMMIREIPRTLGDFNLQLFYDDLKELRAMLGKSN